jgi:alkylhydroperoxidase family enzyme
MLEYVEKLTVNPSGVTLNDLNTLRKHFSEDEVYDIVLYIAS